MSTPTPADYSHIFEDNRVGAAIFADLVARFYARPAVVSGGVDAVLETYKRAGESAVVQYIVTQLKRAKESVPQATDSK